MKVIVKFIFQAKKCFKFKKKKFGINLIIRNVGQYIFIFFSICSALNVNFIEGKKYLTMLN